MVTPPEYVDGELEAVFAFWPRFTLCILLLKDYLGNPPQLCEEGLRPKIGLYGCRLTRSQGRHDQFVDFVNGIIP